MGIVSILFGERNGNDSVLGETNSDNPDLIFGNTEPHGKHVSIGEQVKKESKQAEYQKRVPERIPKWNI